MTVGGATGIQPIAIALLFDPQALQIPDELGFGEQVDLPAAERFEEVAGHLGEGIARERLRVDREVGIPQSLSQKLSLIRIKEQVTKPKLLVHLPDVVFDRLHINHSSRWGRPSADVDEAEPSGPWDVLGVTRVRAGVETKPVDTWFVLVPTHAAADDHERRLVPADGQVEAGAVHIT